MEVHHVRRTLVLLTLALVGVFAVYAQERKEAPKLPAKEWKDATAFKVVRIIDGDTIEIEEEHKVVKVRLIGVDTPETAHPMKSVEQYGKEASRFTTNLLRGESVYLEYDQQKTDRYGRTLAYVFRAPDGLFVNLEIIRQGYGHAYTKYPFKAEYMELFRYYGGQAREAQRGLWAAGEGVDGKETKAEPAQEKKGQTDGGVYLTTTGSKYHCEGCRFLSKSKIPITLEEAKKKYGPCSVCNPPK